MVAPAVTGVTALAVRGTEVYWTTGSGTVMRGSLGEPVTTLASGRDGPQWIAVDETHVYWYDLGVNFDIAKISTVPRAGGTPTDLFTGGTGPRRLPSARPSSTGGSFGNHESSSGG